MKYWIISIFVCLFPLLSNAHSSTLINDNSGKNWTTEAQLNTVSNSMSATFGPALLYSLNPENQLGFRFLAPLGSGPEGTISLMAVYRHHFGENRTKLFGEGSVGTNWYTFGEPRATLNDSSLGTNIGVIHHLNEDISFGGMAGFEWTRTRLEKNFVTREPNSIYAWGRISLFGSLAF